MVLNIIKKTSAFKKIEEFIIWKVLWKKVFVKRYKASPVKAGHQEYTMFYSAADDCSQPNEYLLNVANEAIKTAQEIRMDNLIKRINGRFTYPDPSLWPGEHYRLLGAIVKNLNPKVVIEIGTERGIGTLALKEYLAEGSSLTTFDIFKWDTISNTVITNEDIETGAIVQHLEDLSKPEVFKKFESLFEKADLIFVDAAKDGFMEQKFIEHFNTVKFKNRPLVIFDDTKTWNMLKIWRDISHPKLDMTSFGHFTGTGLVDWKSEIR